MITTVHKYRCKIPNNVVEVEVSLVSIDKLN